MHILDLVAWRHERLPRHSPYSLAKGRLFIWSYLIAFTAQLLLESFQSLFVDFQLHEYQAWHRYHDSQQIPPPANAKGTLQRKRSKCDCGPSTVGFDRFVQGWAANRVYNDSVGTVIDLTNLINLVKSYLFTVGDSGDSLLVFLPVRPSSSTSSWSSGNSSPSLSSVASSVPWENSLFFTANKSDNRVRTTPQRGHPRTLKFQPFQRLYKIYKFGFWFPYILFVECWFRLAWSFGSSWTCTTQCCSADAQYSAVK